MELLRAAQPGKYGFSRICVWGGADTLSKMPRRAWLELNHQPLLDGGILSRLLWQRYRITKLVRNCCDVLFAPGALIISGFRPVVTMSQNMLPFEDSERARYGISYTGLRLRLLGRTQECSFRVADGVIFLSNYAKHTIETRIGFKVHGSAIIPHGISPLFVRPPRPMRLPEEFTREHPFRILYVSIIDMYKHQEKVAAAVMRLKGEGFPVVLDFVGPAYPKALRLLEATLTRLDPRHEVVRYRGAVDYGVLPALYIESDLFVFASSCENMPNILIEAMASGLPIACSDRGPMPEVLRDAGCYFDPEDSDSIYRAVREMYLDRELRVRCAERAFGYSLTYSWVTCADRTLEFIAGIARRRPYKPAAEAAPRSS
ncbi:MAG: glycosyltransferase family 4 protein [Sulfuricaulis sp.]